LLSSSLYKTSHPLSFQKHPIVSVCSKHPTIPVNSTSHPLRSCQLTTPLVHNASSNTTHHQAFKVASQPGPYPPRWPCWMDTNFFTKHHALAIAMSIEEVPFCIQKVRLLASTKMVVPLFFHQLLSMIMPLPWGAS
jgi:hypothetical protein